MAPGRQHYWDGARWTERRRPAAPSPVRHRRLRWSRAHSSRRCA
ncbi:DUF2510 domain-containing protein [Nocardioides sp.]